MDTWKDKRKRFFFSQSSNHVAATGLYTGRRTKTSLQAQAPVTALAQPALEFHNSHSAHCAKSAQGFLKLYQTGGHLLQRILQFCETATPEHLVLLELHLQSHHRLCLHLQMRAETLRGLAPRSGAMNCFLPASRAFCHQVRASSTFAIISFEMIVASPTEGPGVPNICESGRVIPGAGKAGSAAGAATALEPAPPGTFQNQVVGKIGKEQNNGHEHLDIWTFNCKTKH